MRRKARRRTRALVVILTAALAAAKAPAESFSSSTYTLPDFARNAWEATVLLEIRTRGAAANDGGSSTGSGVVVARDEASGQLSLATSAHVVACASACMIRVVFRRQGTAGTVSSRARVVWSDPRRDLALLRARAPRGAHFQVAETAGAASALPSAEVLAIGFPDLRTVRSATRAKRYSKGRLLDSMKRLQSEYRALTSMTAVGRFELEDVLIHSADLLPGSSGGPLIDSRGRVLGINTGSMKEGTVHLAVAVEGVLEQLAAQR